MDFEFQQKRLRSATLGAGERYDTVVNIKIESVLQNLYALNREEPFISSMLKATYHIVNDIPSLSGSGTPKDIELATLSEDLKRLMDRIIAIKMKSRSQKIIWSTIISSLRSQSNTTYDLYSYFKEQKDLPDLPKSEKDKFSSVSSSLWKIYSGINELFEFIDDPLKTKLFNTPLMLLHGEAGIGKTHLLCDYATQRVESGSPTLVFLGHELLAISGSKDPIFRMAILSGYETKEEFVSELTKLVSASKNRVCLIIDAINEGEGIEWDSLIELSKIEGISLVVSIRDGYEFVLKNKKRYTPVKHIGFSEVAWEGVSKFFKHYGLKLPEIPIVNPEFKNPLFLRIFCKSYTTPGKTPRGHGATHVFEHYITNQSLRVYKELGIKLPPKYLWNNLIKRIGIWMGKNGTNNIQQHKLLEIINNDSVLSPHAHVIPNLLEANGLMIKYPHFTKTNKRSGYSFFFTYQRFSDHLIIRSILTENDIQGHDASSKAKDYFRNDPFFVDTLVKYNTGLIEALAIQIPERCSGDELPMLLDPEYRDHHVIKKAFLEGLKWRDLTLGSDGEPQNFDDNQSTEYIKKYFNTNNDFNEVLACMFDVSAIPHHPFNALRIHKILNRLTLGDRDSWFQNFILNNSYEGDAITRLHSWSFSDLINNASAESANLAVTALLWITASTNHNLRDTSSRSTIAILSKHPLEIEDVYHRFKDNNDPYILERLFALIYGVASNCTSDENVMTIIASTVYQEHFLNIKRTPNAIIDDYAFSTISLFIRKYGNKLKFDKSVYCPPYSYEFPSRIHTIKWLRKKYYDKSEYYSIWGSLMYNYGSLADFGRYTMGGALNAFSSYKISEKIPNSIRSKIRSFSHSLSPKQDFLYSELKRIRSNRYSFITNTTDQDLLRIIRHQKTSDELFKEDPLYFKKQRTSFWKFTLSLSPIKLFKLLKLYPYIFDKKELPDRTRSDYDLGIGQRWIFQRVIQLGWDPKKHGDFEKYTAGNTAMNQDRSRIERIGKKYQWIGLHEFAAYLGSNYYVSHDDWDNKKEFTKYEGAHQLGIRDFDPTVDPRLLATREENLSSDNWWVPSYNAWGKPNWAHSTKDIPSSRSLIELSKEGSKYFSLINSFTLKGRSDPPEDDEKYNYPQLWMKVQAYIVNKKDLPAVIKWSEDKEFWDRTLPEMNSYSGDLFLKEFDGSPAYDEQFKYENLGWHKKSFERPFDINQPLQHYSNESNNNLSLNLPSPFLIEKLDLHSSRIGEYISKDGQIKLFDPSITFKEPGTILAISRESFIQQLNKNNLTIFWTTLGEKINISSHHHNDESRGQRLEVHGISYVNKNFEIVDRIRYKNIELPVIK